MPDLPPLTLCICTCGRPWYSVLTLSALRDKVTYHGNRRWIIADGGQDREELEHLAQILDGQDYEITTQLNLAAAYNACAERAGEVWLVTLDDFLPRWKFDITPDVRFLLANEDVGAVRMGRLGFWEHGPDNKLVAEMRYLGGNYWWAFRRAETTHPYLAALNMTLYHRRFWEAYGDIPNVPNDMPGEAETEGADRFNKVLDGPTVAIPQRFGQDSADTLEMIWQIPSWRTPAYAAAGGGRRM